MEHELKAVLEEAAERIGELMGQVGRWEDVTVLHAGMKNLKEWLKERRHIDSALNEAYVKLSPVRWNSNPEKSEWFNHLYDAEIDIRHRLS